MTLKSQSMREIIKKLDFIKIKNFCFAKDNVKRIEDKLQTGRKYLQNIYLIKDCYPKYTKNLKLNKKTNNLIKKWAKELNRYLTKEDIQMTNKYMKRCSTLYVIREMQIKTTTKYHSILIRMAKICNTNNTKYKLECEGT